jgi:hypothetical protein
MYVKRLKQLLYSHVPHKDVSVNDLNLKLHLNNTTHLFISTNYFINIPVPQNTNIRCQNILLILARAAITSTG